MSPRASVATAEMPMDTTLPASSRATHSCSSEYCSSGATFAMCSSFALETRGLASRGRGRAPLRHPAPEVAGLLLALVERQCHHFEGLRFAAEVDVQGGAGFGVGKVDVGQGHRVAKARAGLA